MANEIEEFKTEEPKAESIATANILKELESQAQEDVASVNPIPEENPKHTSAKANDSNAFRDILNIEKKETKSKKVNFLLTETNFNHLVELSKKANASRNEIINRLIHSCYQNADL